MQHSQLHSRRPAEKKTRKFSARDAARFALSDVFRGGAYASQAIGRQLNAQFFKPEDRRLATSIFYLAAENRLQIEYLLRNFLEGEQDPVVEDILHIATAQLLYMNRVPDHAAVDEAVKQVRAAKREGLTGLVNAVLHGVIRARDENQLRLPDRAEDFEGFLSVQYSYAPNLVRRLIAAYGPEEAEKIVSCPPFARQVVRLNRMKTGEEDFENYLTSRDVSFARGIVPGAYRCPSSGDLTRLDGFRDGYFSLQGESSMLAALAVEPRRGMNVLDACAAPGGKAALIAETMSDVGRVYAWDIHAHRVDLIRAAKRRMFLDSLRPAVRDARKPYPDFDLLMDAVLVDAPCSGLGVVGDKPDIKYRLSDKSIEELIPLQAEILENCANFVRVGGLLVYSTCTLLPEENQGQVRAFLEKHPEFRPEENVEYLPEALRPHVQEGMLQILPHRDDLEGFFIARMRRVRA
ncbi:MAG TPA: 16S rRNA (cytosine(967)-C(5))-methyltransferase RsmB [Candidatus Pullichristensenella excrementigallinarum]|uniref:16S rRNA (cytosine(967)-C(5))-methyltransferase n=1 Tax=Candidatus Pullichristensenella excrementigallinarum TaxID=2840907 RepID=A0A9D1IC31_9FIRM|nr:16S rRNA (cytosine(967)-C(5))-methyltransferase RsmB [Candidatus Pullichristensenella excrementigallinarum]